MNLLLWAIALFAAWCARCEGGKQHVCLQSEFRCRHREKCVPAAKVCDGFSDCADGADEKASLCQSGAANQSAEAGCQAGWFSCSFGGACVPRNASCDGRVHCPGASDESLDLCQKQTCSSREFRCSYGACVSARGLCDGRVDCVDHSDESSEACRDHACAPTQFRCRYGACVGARKLCDGRRNCWDHSDENRKLCAHIFRSMLRANATAFQPVPSHAAGGRCKVSCPSLRSSLGVEEECVEPKTHRVISCRSKIIPAGTVARFHCAPHFQPVGKAGMKADKVCGPDGRWRKTKSADKNHRLDCALECGRWKGEQRKWPWIAQVTIRDEEGKWSKKCAATLISQSALLTAASCLQHKLPNSTFETVQPHDLQVLFYDDKDEEVLVQQLQVKSAVVHPNFTMLEEAMPPSNLAVLILKKQIRSFGRVLPVCISRQQNSLLEEIHLKVGSKGTVPITYVEETNSVEGQRLNLSEVVREMEVAPVEACKINVRLEATENGTREDPRSSVCFCATHPESTEECKMPTAAGMVFPTGSDSEQRWVLHGLLMPSQNPCEASRSFIRLGPFVGWLDSFLNRVMRS